MIWREELKRHLWKNIDEGGFALEDLKNFSLRGIPRHKIGKFLRQLGFERRSVKGMEKEYFITPRAKKELKKRRLAFKCNLHEPPWEGYVTLEEDQDLKEGSSTIISHKGDRKGERDLICYCPECNNPSGRVVFNSELDPWQLKEKVVFKVDPPKEDHKKYITGGLF